MGNVHKKPAKGRGGEEPAQVSCANEGAQDADGWHSPMWVPAGLDGASVKMIIEAAKGIPVKHQSLRVKKGAGKSSSPKRGGYSGVAELTDTSKVPSGADLDLVVLQQPIKELDYRLSRIDSGGVQLAKKARDPPWRTTYEKHCLPSDSEPGLLGHGGYAKVYRVRRRGAPLDTGDLYAVKQILKARVSHSYSQVRQLILEVCCSRMLPQHPNLIHVSEVIHDDAVVYYLMPLTHGKEMYDLIQDPEAQGKLKKQAVIAPLMRQLLSAIDHLHQRGIAHRDVKPENILCDPDNAFHPTLIDLGLARFCGDPTSQLTPGGLMGVPKTSALQEVDFGDLDDEDQAAPPKVSESAYRAMLDVMPTPGAMTTAYASQEAITSALMLEERHRSSLPAMDMYGLGASMFAVLVRMVPFLRNGEMQSLPQYEWMQNMVERSKRGIEQERGWDTVQHLLDRDGCSFLSKMLHPDLGKRHTSKSALADKWLRTHAPPPKTAMLPMKTPLPHAVQHRGGQQKAGAVEESAVAPAPCPHRRHRRPADDHEWKGAENIDASDRAAALTLVPRRNWERRGGGK